MATRRLLLAAWRAPVVQTRTARRLFSSQSNQIFIKNSLTGEKEALRIPENKPLTWYMCGPTVYDHSHLGHARTYTAFDILYRLMTDYFNLPVCMTMGITDIDDKIIQRASERGEAFGVLARRFENDFVADMKTLNVRPPHTYLRVSEHVDEIIAYIQTLERQGVAYTVEAEEGRAGGVYFDVNAFNAKGHAYGKLKAGSQEGREDTGLTGKRSPTDFALWKHSKGGEPSWEAPFGSGRPGWHIECSAMCGQVFGAKLDLHTGGIDLAFPHHCNEIAQCEAHGGGDWAQVFLHTGHLHIQGMKMSKSTKNFITIKDFLSTQGPDAFRMLCLLNRYSANFDYTDTRMEAASGIISRFQDFFEVARLSAAGSEEPATQRTKNWSQAHVQLSALLTDTQSQVDNHLRDDFDTHGAVHALLALCKGIHAVPPGCCPELLEACESYVGRILTTFGLRFHRKAATTDSTATAAQAVLDVLTAFRSSVRATARRHAELPGGQELLELCDAIRNDALPNAGVVLKDLANGGWSARLLSPEEAAARQLKCEAKSNKGSNNKLPNLIFASEMTPPDDLFRKGVVAYTQFDYRGVPTHDSDDQPLTKSQSKKLNKKMEKYLKTIAKARVREARGSS